MQTEDQVITGGKLIAALVEAGAVQKNTTRVIIDASFDGIVRVYTEVMGDSRLVNADFMEVLSRGIKHYYTQDRPK